MNLSTQQFDLFRQTDYNNTFYCCQNEHPFIAFTTCFCPLCETTEELIDIHNAHKELENALDNLTEEYHLLVIKAKKHAPEILV